LNSEHCHLCPGHSSKEEEGLRLFQRATSFTLYLDMRSCGNISCFWKERSNVVQKSLKTTHPKDTKVGMNLSRSTWSLLTLPFCLLTIWTCFWHKSKDTMLLVGCKPNQICLPTLSRHKSLQHHILRLAGTLHVVICCFSAVIYDCHFEISLTSRLPVPKTLMSKSLSSQSLFRDCCTRVLRADPRLIWVLTISTCWLCLHLTLEEMARTSRYTLSWEARKSLSSARLYTR
jgi:hypothetical protein